MERVHVRGQATKPALFDDVSHSWESRRSKNGAEAKTVPHTLKLLIVPAEHCIASFVGVWVFSVGLFVSELWVHYVEKKRGVHLRMRCMWVYYMWVYYMWVYYTRAYYTRVYYDMRGTLCRYALQLVLYLRRAPQRSPRGSLPDACLRRGTRRLGNVYI